MHRQLRVGIDVSSAVDTRPTGIARYIHALVDRLARLDDPPELTLFCRASRLRRIDPHSPLGVHPVRRMPLVFGGVDLLHSTDVRLPYLLRVPAVVTIHDLSAFERDDHATGTFLRKKRTAIERAARRAKFIITQSETVRGAIVDRFSLPEDRVIVIPLASGLPNLRGAARGDCPRHVRRLLIVGGPSVRKGEARIAPLLHFFDAELDWRPEIDWVGSGSSDDCDRVLATLERAAHSRIRFHGHVDDERLDALYHEVDGFLQLSDTEGFAMPLIEAAERGCPILSIDAHVLRETIGDGAIYFDDDLEESRCAFQRFRTADGRQTIRNTARLRSEELRWSRTAESTYRVYSRCIAQA